MMMKIFLIVRYLWSNSTIRRGLYARIQFQLITKAIVRDRDLRVRTRCTTCFLLRYLAWYTLMMEVVGVFPNWLIKGRESAAEQGLLSSPVGTKDSKCDMRMHTTR
ncbi:unnamed protein product [Amoebophrya sp. A25]|nr:unnamed protein product [Amoebophrya sp. A25]|eukprot:GSA25T00021951001.1